MKVVFVVVDDGRITCDDYQDQDIHKICFTKFGSPRRKKIFLYTFFLERYLILA